MIGYVALGTNDAPRLGGAAGQRASGGLDAGAMPIEVERTRDKAPAAVASDGPSV